MLDTTELCSHLVHLSHVPIRYYTADAEYQCTYADQGGYPDPLRCDPDLEAMLLEKASVSAPKLYFELDAPASVNIVLDDIHRMGKEFEQENSFYSGKNGKKKIESGNK